jgi:hypothetical protein
MDPNAALELIRRLVKESDTCTDNQAPHLLEQLAVAVDGLDEWLSRGGFLPDPWQRYRHG